MLKKKKKKKNKKKKKKFINILQPKAGLINKQTDNHVRITYYK